ncbi:hypothetical protein ABZ379_10345 [Streptomyces canus]|uniref:hypothetical protein n=1 Tax=Streptomyces canus TaxID=58343 RepID=UPI00340566C2
MRVRLPGPSRTAGPQSRRAAGPQGRRAAGPQEEETMIPTTLEHASDAKAGVR